MREKVHRTGNDERLFILGLAILLCVYFGPFNTDVDFDMWRRLAFWTLAVSSVGLVIEHCMLTVLNSHWFARFHLGIRLVIGAMIGAVPGASLMIAINTIFRPEHLDVVTFPIVWINVTIMSLMISSLDFVVSRQLRSSQPEDTPLPTETLEPQEKLARVRLPQLFSRLPDRLREGQIISMSMQDHYVEITTTLGAEMLLMRLTDAVDLLDGMAGVQTHRSHWAARAHAVELTKSGRRHDLTLSDGRTLPVSNSHKSDVEKMLKAKEQA